MSRLADEGFLSNETTGVVEAVERRYGPWLAIFRSVNERAVKSERAIKIVTAANARYAKSNPVKVIG